MKGAVYFRKANESHAIRLGDGKALALSPDGKQALSLLRTFPPQLSVLPTGAGEARMVALATRGPRRTGRHKKECTESRQRQDWVRPTWLDPAAEHGAPTEQPTGFDEQRQSA